MSEISDQIAADALKAYSVANANVSLTRRDISEQIEADRYLAEKAAAANMSRTVKNMFSRIVPPGGH